MFGLSSRRQGAPSGPEGYRAYVVGDIHGRLDLQPTDIGGREQDLALEIGQGDLVVVDHGQPPDARRRQILDRGRADAARPDQDGMRIEQPLLPGPANLLEDDVAGITVELVVPHMPVEPKPPSPRLVSSSSSTSANRACCTGAGTSWAMRSPRATGKGSAPRLARMIFTSPR